MLLTALLVAACASPVVRSPVPADQIDTALPLGIEGLRYWGDDVPGDDIDAIVATRLAGLTRLHAADLAAGRRPVVNLLTVSGGGQWGAFTAGILKAWSESGDRPRFDVVTGISTGAIIAPMAFLGPSRDAELEKVYTTLSTRDVLTATVLSGLISGMALADTGLLARQIATCYTQEVLDEIAAEHRRGRVLLVGTTNLDASRPVIRDMGAIAASGHPGALDLFRQVILASASIPVAFPPALIRVIGPDGVVRDEMHVDGGSTSQVTLASPQVVNALVDRPAAREQFHRRLFVLMNNDVTPACDPVRPRLAGIGARAISALIRSSGIGDIYKLYLISERAGGESYRTGRLWHDVPPWFDRPG